MEEGKDWVEEIENIAEKYDVKEIAISIKLDPDPPEKTRSKGEDGPKTPASQAAKLRPYDFVRDAVIRAFDDLDGYKFPVDKLVSEVFARHEGKLDIKRNSVQTYVYDALKELIDEGMVEKVGRGEFMRLADYDLNKLVEQTKLIEEDTVPSAAGAD